ncbi:MAG: hypothetical protein RBU30_21150 [Polyangia bacterium]|jgi:hypothetical protein|nr:hypothetical protein [Polyangia bacterium]
MEEKDLQQAWVRQALLDAERGVMECRMCREHVGLNEAVTLWRNGVLVFGVCDRCAGTHDIVMRRVDAGLEVRARPRVPLVVRSPGMTDGPHVSHR